MPVPKGEQPRRVTEDDYELFRELYSQNLGRNEIARQMGIPASTVSLIAKRIGVRFDNTQTELAAEAVRAQAALRRSQLSLALLNDAMALREQMWEPTVIGNFGGRNNQWNQVELPQPPDTAKRNLAQALAVLVDRSLRLEEYDQHAGDDQVIGMLDGLELTIRRAATEIEQDEASGSDDTPGG